MAYPQTIDGDRLNRDGKAVDSLGRKQPRRLGLDSFLRAQDIGTVLLAAFDQQVPGSFWGIDVDDDGDEYVIVSCPCGEEPGIELNNTVECECGRIYAWLGTQVRVFRPEGVEAGVPEITPDDEGREAPDE